MRPLALTLGLLGLASCSSLMDPSLRPEPVRLQALAAGTATQAFGCGMRHVNEMGYVVTEADRESGFIRAERDHTGLGEALLGGIEAYDQLTVSIYPHEDGRTMLRVVPGGYEVQTRGENVGARVSRAASDKAYSDIRTILRGCGDTSAAVATAPASEPAALGHYR